MGFMKDIGKLSKQGKELQKNMDVGATMANAQQQMQAAQEMMAKQTQAANLAATGLAGTATVVAVRQGGAMVNFQPVCQIDLTVMPEGRPPYPATVEQVVPQVQLAALQPGANLRVKTDPNDPSVVWIDPSSIGVGV